MPLWAELDGVAEEDDEDWIVSDGLLRLTATAMLLASSADETIRQLKFTGFRFQVLTDDDELPVDGVEDEADTSS